MENAISDEITEMIAESIPANTKTAATQPELEFRKKHDQGTGGMYYGT